MTLFFNLHRVGWQQTPLLRFDLSLPWDAILRVACLLLILLLLLVLARDTATLRSTMADALVAARIDARDWQSDAQTLMNGGMVAMKGYDGAWHSVSCRERQHLTIKE